MDRLLKPYHCHKCIQLTLKQRTEDSANLLYTYVASFTSYFSPSLTRATRSTVKSTVWERLGNPRLPHGESTSCIQHHEPSRACLHGPI